jgi:hypothetical protein
MFCGKCGQEIEEGAEFCGNCGNKINTDKSSSSQNGYSDQTTTRMRHGFTSFWLIFGIIVCSLAAIFYLFLSNLFDELYIYMPPGLIAINGVAMLVQIVGLSLLLSWKKIGFWILIGVSAISLLVGLASGGSPRQIIGALVGIAICWGVLQLKKNGKTAWEQLE